MLTFYRLALATAVLCGYAAWTVVHAADAQPAAAGPATEKSSGGNHRRGPGGEFGLLGHLSRQLDLTADQRSQIQAIMTASRGEDTQWRQQLEELRKQVHDTVVANGYDENQVRALVQAKSTAMIEMAVHGISTLARIRTVLTPEQQQKLEQLQANRPKGGPGFGPLGSGPLGFGSAPGM